jgi:signal transduction histidine kinase
VTTATARQPTLEHPERPSAGAPRRGLGAFLALVARDTLYLLLALPMGTLFFGFVVAGWSTAIGSFITFIGVPVAVLTIWGTRGLAWVERARAAIVTGERIPGLYRRRLPFRGEDWSSLNEIWTWLKALVLDGQTWRDTAYGLVLLFTGTIGFTVAVTMWSLTLSLLSVPAWWWIPGVDLDAGFIALDTWLEALVVFGLGLASIPLTLALVRGSSAISISIARGLLGCDKRRLEERVEHLAETRAGAVDAAQAELERIERDLHDGAQARLVAVALDLGMAEQRLAAGADPERAAELVREAREETQRALAELRDLARGIRPALLAERGLGAAVTSLGARVGGVPTSVEVGDLGALPSAVETAAYFVVAEALTNVAKHAQASAASVRLSRAGDVLRVEVRDDGVGGANPDGGGLHGLRGRVEALDGTLTVTSPPGGPTHLCAELPCGS